MENINYCILDKNKICDQCGDCLVCTLDPNKICDNCCACLEQDLIDYKTILIDKIIFEKGKGGKSDK